MFEATSLRKANEMLERMQATKKRIAEKAEAKMGVGIAAAEATLTAGGFGLANEAFGKPDKDGDYVISVGPVELDFLSGFGLHALGFFDMAGKHSEHLHNVGTGALCSFAVTQGRKMGRARREGSTTTKGAMGGGRRSWHADQREAARVPR